MALTSTMQTLNRARVDQVGSLVRPASLAEASLKSAKGLIPASELKELEDDAIRKVVGIQDEIGLPVVTDGEFRRRNFQDSFGSAVVGFASTAIDPGSWMDPNNPMGRSEPNYNGSGPAVATRRPTAERLRLKHNLILDEYKFAASLTDTPVKVSLIGPDRISQRFDWEKSRAIYADLDSFVADVVSIERQMIKAVIDAGCRYIHIDAPGLTAYIDDISLDRMRARGEDPARNLARSIEAENALIEGFDGVTFGLHICRGNARGVDAKGKIQPQWHREGHYTAIAERLFAQLKHQRLLLEYDSERAGGFEALRFVPKDTVVVLGLVTTKSEDIESVDDIRERVEAASRFKEVDQLAISPQCGFSSGIGPAQLPEEVQWAKLKNLMRAAESIWL